MSYIWQHHNWPSFHYQDSIAASPVLYQYVQAVSSLTVDLTGIPEDMHLDTMIDLMVGEAVTTSAIEGEVLSPDDVRSSLKNHLGLMYPPLQVRDPRAKGISALMVSQFEQKDSAINEEVLFRWHKMLLPRTHDAWGRNIRVGKWRTDGIDVVSGPSNKQRIHFEAPPATSIATEMSHFFDWYQRTQPPHSIQQTTSSYNSLPGPIRAALTHLWFVTIHPFDDGNGRIARALSDHALAQDARQPMLHSLSTAIEGDKNAYYEQLEHAQRGTLDISDWLSWFIEICYQAVMITKRSVGFTVQKARFLKQYQPIMNDRQQKVVVSLFANGVDGDSRSINRNKYVRLNHCSPSTALRDLKDLVNKHVLKALPGKGRNSRYGLNFDG